VNWTFPANRVPALLCVAQDPRCVGATSWPPGLRPQARVIGEILTLLTGSNTTET